MKDVFSLLSSEKIEPVLKNDIWENDGGGFVRIVDMIPRLIPQNEISSDFRIAQTARISYLNSKTVSSDRNLIRYLYRHQHMTPFESIVFTFHIRTPNFVMKQWLRHRSGSFNEESQRYTIIKNAFYIPSTFRKQSKTNKQGSSEEKIDDSSVFISKMKEIIETSYNLYADMIDNGVTKEQARIILPNNIYTEFYWTVNLRNLLHFLQLRLEADAQEETRNFAQAIFDLIYPLVPISLTMFEEYTLNQVTFYKNEIPLLLDHFSSSTTTINNEDKKEEKEEEREEQEKTTKEEREGNNEKKTKQLPTKREHDEFRAKLLKFNNH